MMIGWKHDQLCRLKNRSPALSVNKSLDGASASTDRVNIGSDSIGQKIQPRSRSSPFAPEFQFGIPPHDQRFLPSFFPSYAMLDHHQKPLPSRPRFSVFLCRLRSAESPPKLLLLCPPYPFSRRTLDCVNY
jgi:hypothetical protein